MDRFNFWSLSFLLYAAFYLCLAGSVLASDVPHFTVIVNQVRGRECCDAGSLEFFSAQIASLEEQNLSGTFVLRYDALTDPEFISQAQAHPEFEYGGLLEVTPSLAQAAGVKYSGTPEQWFETQYVFFAGYSPKDRVALIDAYMEQFTSVFGRYPRTTTAWMLDAFSLQYLDEKYAVRTHQITREQFGTDSYTLYGGPPHYPYWSSRNWALIPDSTQRAQMPLIVRQTITDPVFNYGDQSNSYTSQPNDYRLRGATLDYFKFLFNQAHAQPESTGYTFALIGGENSLSDSDQSELKKQFTAVSDWQKEHATAKSVTADSFYSWIAQHDLAPISVYSGVSQSDSSEKAWWITTDNYRARVRLSDGVLSITDLRIYDTAFTDPYLDKQAHSLGWWIVPYALDGSRSETTNEGFAARTDILKDRPDSFPEPHFWRITDQADPISVTLSAESLDFIQNGHTVLTFTPIGITPSQSHHLPEQNEPLSNLQWQLPNSLLAWGFIEEDGRFTVTSNAETLDLQRQTYQSLLFPEVQVGTVSAQTTTLYKNNTYAVAGRNPARMVLFPQDEQARPVFLKQPPQVSIDTSDAKVVVSSAHGSNGMIFIDISSMLPISTQLTVSVEAFSESVSIYIAPNCRQDALYCLKHPVQTWWFLRSWLNDKLRFIDANQQKTEQQF